MTADEKESDLPDTGSQDLDAHFTAFWWMDLDSFNGQWLISSPSNRGLAFNDRHEWGENNEFSPPKRAYEPNLSGKNRPLVIQVPEKVIFLTQDIPESKSLQGIN